MESYVVHQDRHVNRQRGLGAYTILTKGPVLNSEQIVSLQELLFNPRSYYPDVLIFYRRLPHVPGFGLRWVREKEILDLMIDLHNPGWDFCCGRELYISWHEIGDQLVRLAKSLFPELASSDRRSVWRQGVIRGLILEKAG